MNGSFHGHSVSSMALGTIEKARHYSKTLHVLAPLILITTLWAGNYYYPCFIDEKRRFRTQAFRYQKPYIGTYGNDYYFSGVISFKITGYIHFLLD